MRGGIDGGVLQDAGHLSGEGVDLADAVDLIAEVLDADGVLGLARGEDLDGVSPYAELGADEVDVVALVVQFHQFSQQVVPGIFLSGAQRDDHALVVDGRTDGVDARDGRHDDDVSALRKAQRGRMTQFVDLIVDGRVLLDIGVCSRHIGLRLVVVVVGDEVLHRVVREHLPEFGAELGRQGLVVRQHERGAIGLRDDVGHGEGLAGAGDAFQRLLLVALLQPLHQSGNGFRLVAGGLEFRLQFKVVHRRPSFRQMQSVMMISRLCFLYFSSSLSFEMPQTLTMRPASWQRRT